MMVRNALYYLLLLARNLKRPLFLIFLLIGLIGCGTEGSKNNEDSITVEELVGGNTKREIIEVNAYFETKLNNIMMGIKENQSRLTSLESRIEEVIGKSAKNKKEDQINNFESEWTEIFNGNNEIESLAFSAQDNGDEQSLNRAQEKLTAIDAQIDLLDLALFKTGTSTNTKAVKIDKSVVKSVEEQTEVNPTITKKKSEPATVVKASDNTSNNKQTSLVAKVPSSTVKNNNDNYSNNYDASLGMLVLEDCKRLSRKAENIAAAGKKLTTAKNAEYANFFGDEINGVNELIEWVEKNILEIESVIESANNTRNTNQVFTAKQKTQEISAKILEAETIVLSLAQKVDVENRKKANREEEEKRQKALAQKKAEEAKENIAKNGTGNSKVAKADNQIFITEAELDAIALETITKLMELSPQNRSQSITADLESKFIDSNSQTVFLVIENSKVKKYSIKDYMRKMIISGPYFIKIRHIEMNENRKITRIDLQDTKVQ